MPLFFLAAVGGTTTGHQDYLLSPALSLSPPSASSNNVKQRDGGAISYTVHRHRGHLRRSSLSMRYKLQPIISFKGGYAEITIGDYNGNAACSGSNEKKIRSGVTMRMLRLTKLKWFTTVLLEGGEHGEGRYQDAGEENSVTYMRMTLWTTTIPLMRMVHRGAFRSWWFAE